VAPGNEQTTHRLGNSRSSSTRGQARRQAVTRLCQKCTGGVTSSRGHATAAAAQEEALSLGGKRSEPSRVELVGTLGRPQAPSARPASGPKAARAT
jgi:hypothetical protein